VSASCSRRARRPRDHRRVFPSISIASPKDADRLHQKRASTWIPRPSRMRATSAFRRRVWKLPRLAMASLFLLSVPCIKQWFPNRILHPLQARSDVSFDGTKLLRANDRYCRRGGTKVCAHGGDSARHVANTMDAFQSAWEGGVRCLEADAAATKDGQLVVLHARELNQMMGKKDVQVNDLTWEEIQQLGIQANVQVPKVEDVLVRYAHLVDLLIVDVKTQRVRDQTVDEERIAQQVVDVVKKTQCDTCLAWSKSEGVIRSLQGAWPSLSTGIVVQGNQIVPGKDVPDSTHRRLAKVVAYHHEMVDEDTIAQADGQGKQIIAWTANDRDSVQRLLDLGVYGLVTNFPIPVQRAIDERNKQCKPINTI